MRKLFLSLLLVVVATSISRAIGQTAQTNGTTTNGCPVLPPEPNSLKTSGASLNAKTSSTVSPNGTCGDPPPGGPIVFNLDPVFSCTPTSLSPGGNVTCTVVLAPGVTSPVTFTANGTLWATATPDASGTATATQALNGNPGTYAMAFDYPGETTGTFIQTIYPPAADTTWVTLTQPTVIVPLPPVNALYYFRIADSNSVIGYQANGNIQNYTDSVNGTWTLGYDALNRLVSSQQAPITASPVYGCWNYDNFGNMLTQVISTASINSSCQAQSGSTSLQSISTYNALNQAISGIWLDATHATHTGSPSYDTAGNITNDLVNNYLYDADGKICAVQSGPGSITGYLYDADGNRVAKTVLSSFTCDPSAIASITAEYFIGPDGDVMTEINPMLNGDPWVRTEVSAAGQYLATYKPDGVHYQITDWLGTKRMQINPNNTLIANGIEESCSSYPFGDQLKCDVPLDASSRHFTGKERDSESGLDYFGARYYGSTMGRFMSPDWAMKAEPVPYAKLDDPQSLNLYAYGGNNPLSKADADGHNPYAAALELSPWLVECPICEGVLWGSATVLLAYEAYQIYHSRQAAPGSRPGQDFTRAGKKTIDQTNATQNGGDNKCTKCGKKVRKVKNTKGEPTPEDQLQRHHIKPKSEGGSGTPENGEVVCPPCHQEIHNPTPTPDPSPIPEPSPTPEPSPSPAPDPKPVPQPKPLSTMPE